MCVLCVQRTKIRRLSVRMAMASFAHIFNGMWPFFTVNIRTIPNVLAHTHTHTIFRIISMRVSIYFDFNFRLVPKSSLPFLVNTPAEIYVCMCVTSDSIVVYSVLFIIYTLHSFSRSYFIFQTLFPNVPLDGALCSICVHVMHLYV